MLATRCWMLDAGYSMLVVGILHFRSGLLMHVFLSIIYSISSDLLRTLWNSPGFNQFIVLKTKASIFAIDFDVYQLENLKASA